MGYPWVILGLSLGYPWVILKSDKARYRIGIGWEVLLELSTALLKIQAITRKDGKKMTHKEVREAFEKLFDHPIKDAKGNLATAVNRKKSVTPFLDSLVGTFEAYSQERDEK